MVEIEDVVKTVPPSYSGITLEKIGRLLGIIGGAPGGKPPNRHNAVIVALVLVAIVALSFTNWLPSGLLIELQVLVFTFLICLIPALSALLTKGKGRALRALTEIFMLLGLIAAFTLWMFGPHSFGTWALYAASIIIIIEVGGHLVEGYKDRKVSYLSGLKLFKRLGIDAATIEMVFRRQQIFYLSVPVGLIVGAVLGYVLDYPAASVVKLCLIAVLLPASVMLLLLSVHAVAQMISPILKTGSVSSPKVEGLSRQGSGTAPQVPNLYSFISFHLPEEVEKEVVDEQELDAAGAAAEVRKVFLLDSIHNLILLVIFVSIIIALSWGAVSVNRAYVLIVLLAFFLLNHAPYIIGQSRMHNSILDRFTPTKREQVSEKLKKVAPLFPKFESLASLATSGAGTLLFFVVDEAIKKKIK